MANKDLMIGLSKRLEPVREEFKRRECQWALELIEEQAMKSDSLFWELPNHVVKNLQKTLGNSHEDKILAFFMDGYRQRYRQQLADHGPPPKDLETERIRKLCMNPNEVDVQKLGLVPFPFLEAKLNRKNVLNSLKKYVDPMMGSKIERSASGEWEYRTIHEPWIIVSSINLIGNPYQIELDHEVRLGRGDLHIARQISIHGCLAVSPTAWNIAKTGQEEAVAKLIGQYCRLFFTHVPQLLDGLDPGISSLEVQSAEAEWEQWFKELRMQRNTGQGEKL